MSRVIVFGAGGRAGRAVVRKALAQGHTVTAAVRDPDAYWGQGAVHVVGADVTDAASVAVAAAGHDVAVCAAYHGATDPAVFFPGAAGALVAGLPPETRKLVWIGLGVTPDDVPAEHRPFAQAHLAGLEVLRGTASPREWAVVTPPPAVLDDDGYADLADRVVGEIGVVAG